MPTLRMQERFIDCTHECDATLRDEISTSLIPWFRKRFSILQISLLQNRKLARVFATYAELNPALV